MKPCRIRSKLTVRDIDPLVREHRVHDIHILPGVSLLDVTYKTLAAAKWRAESVVLRGILFHEPVVTHAQMDRHLTITIEMTTNKGRVTVTSVPSRGDHCLSGNDTLHMTCTVERDEGFELAFPPDDFAARTGAAVDLDCCYGVTRHIGIFHDSFMKCLGTVAPLVEGDCIATVALGERAAEKADDFLLHPVFLDCATIVPLFNLRERLGEANLFIPFAIEEFRARSLSGICQLRVVVEKSDVGNTDQEILRYSSALYDLAGRPLARLRNFGVKRVRSLDAIHRLLAFGTSGRSAAPVATETIAVTAPPVAAQSAPLAAPDAQEADATLALIGALIVQHGDVPWSVNDARTPFFDLGLDSLALLNMSEQLEKKLTIRLYPTLLFECPTASQLAAYLDENFPTEIALWKGKQAGAAPVCAGVVENVVQHTTPTEPQHRQAPQILVPRWAPAIDTSAMEIGVSAVVLLDCAAPDGLMDDLALQVGDRVRHRSRFGPGVAMAAAFRQALERGLAFDAIWLVGPDHHAAFALVQMLRDCGRLESVLSLKAISLNAFSIHTEACDAQAGHGVWGLWQSVSREYSSVATALLDLDRSTWQASVAAAGGWLRLMALGAGAARDLRAVRAGRIYVRNVYGVQPAKNVESSLRQGGVYLIIGGAGGVGLEFAAYLRSRYAANVAISGRSALDATLRARLAALGEYGKELLYVQASVDDEPQLSTAIQRVEQHFGALHGIIHSAMVLDDKRLADMDEECFARVLRPKVDGAKALARASAGMPLDFLLFFSSMQSFVGNASQSNYAAASTFIDGFAASMRAGRSHPVVVVNWGFWSEVGAVATGVYRHLLARQGLFGLRSAEALQALEQVLAEGYEQALIVGAEESVFQQMGVKRDLVLQRHQARSAALRVPARFDNGREPAWRTLFSDTERAMHDLLALARRRVCQVLRDLGVCGDAAQQAVSRGDISREHAALVRALLRRLQRTDAFSEEGMDEQSFADALACLAAAQPCLRHFIPLLHASIAAYPEILRGRLSAADALFPGGSAALVRAVYGESDISRYYNQAVANAVLALVATQSDRPVRVLEIGAGTGATSVEVLRVLSDAGIACEYRYTDLWDRLVNEARDTLGPLYPTMRFGFLDVGVDPARQGMHETFDIVVATNVLHATRDLRLALRHTKCLLREGGALVLNESVTDQEFSMYTFGSLPGWWSASDQTERLADSPLASADSWSALMQDEGYRDVTAMMIEDPDIPAMNAQQVFVAISDGETRHAGAQRPASERPIHDRQLPPALTGKLRPYELIAVEGISMPRPRHLRLFMDERDNPWLFLDNPPANTFTDELLGELCLTLRQLSKKASTILHQKLLYISHFGEYFSLGGDRVELMRKLAAGDTDGLRSFAEKARELLGALASLDAIVVAVVDGTAQGGGLETLMATDIQLVRDGIKVGLPEIKSGLIPGMGGLSYLQRQIGTARTKRLVMLGELISAREACDLGVVSHVVEDPFQAALALPEQLSHFRTARHMKEILARRTADDLALDIDDWLHYLTDFQDSIDAERIAASGALINAKSLQTPIKEKSS